MNFVDKDGTTKVYIPVHPWSNILRVITIALRIIWANRRSSDTAYRHCRSSITFLTNESLRKEPQGYAFQVYMRKNNRACRDGPEIQFSIYLI